MTKNFFKAMTVAVFAIIAGYNVYLANAENGNVVSDLLMANVEALSQSEELPEVLIECSKDCDDGIGRCWVESKAKKCVWSGYQIDNCSHYPCG